MLRKVAFAVCVIALAPGFTQAKEWAQKMFAASSHDFGHVARGAKAEFAFELQNVYEEDIHILDVRTSCGCTTPTITKPTLKTWEKGSIVATLNTRSFVGQRNSTLTVVIDKPFYAEVPLTIAGNIHSDVDFQPGVAALGDIEQGASGEQAVSVTYRGPYNWQIVDIRSVNTNLEVELADPVRQPGVISYKMTVRLRPGAPSGILQDQLTLVTNDQRMPAVVLPVEGRVIPPLSINPSPLLFGTLAPGQTANKQLVITGKQPFHILSAAAESESLQFKVASDVAKKVHFIPVTVTAPDQPGDFRYTITVQTDLATAPQATVEARGTVRGDSASAPTAATRSRPHDVIGR